MIYLIWTSFHSSQIDILVSSVAETEGETVDFEKYEANTRYVSGMPTGTIYVAARFNSRDDVPSEFALGDDFTRNGFKNGRLNAGTTYQYALRVYSATDHSLMSVSNVHKIRTAGTAKVTDNNQGQIETLS